MSRKFFKIIFAAVLSIGLVSQANATIIVSNPNGAYFVQGENYTDSFNNLWEYIGFYDLADGLSANDDPMIFTGKTAAIEALNVSGPLEDIAVSAFIFDANQGELTRGQFENDRSDAFNYDGTIIYDVNFSAWYDFFTGSIAIKSEEFVSDVGSDNKYSAVGDASAYVVDRTTNMTPQVNLNYVFKRVIEVPEPSTIALFALAICGLAIRRIKR